MRDHAGATGRGCMTEQRAGKLRIYADFNSRIGDDRGLWCRALRHVGRRLDDAAAKLDLRDGLPVTLYSEDPLEWDVDAVLGHVEEPGFDDI